jgi:hypothetical protein
MIRQFVTDDIAKDAIQMVIGPELYPEELLPEKDSVGA